MVYRPILRSKFYAVLSLREGEEERLSDEEAAACNAGGGRFSGVAIVTRATMVRRMKRCSQSISSRCAERAHATRADRLY
jgi:hypothetical protein